jgi:hypothetical protein
MTCLAPNLIFNWIGYVIDNVMVDLIKAHLEASCVHDMSTHQTIVVGSTKPSISYNILQKGDVRSNPDDIQKEVANLLSINTLPFVNQVLPVSIACPTYRVMH